MGLADRIYNLLSGIAHESGRVLGATIPWTGSQSYSGFVTFSGAIRNKVVQIVTTSVLTTTTLTAAVHAGVKVVITSGTSLATKRHRIKLPNATTAAAGDVYTICNGIAGVLTSNGIMVKGTTLDSILGGAGAGKNLKSSTRGTVGTCIQLQAVTTNTYAIVGRANGIAAASTSLVWRTT